MNFCLFLLPMENTIFSKPKLRGHLHGMAFFVTLGWTVIFLLASILYKFDLPIFIYLMSQLLLFGVSSCYHVFDWPVNIKKFLRVCDHMSIFFLISGTQTSVILSVIPKEKIKEVLGYIKLSWAISLVGILRLIFIRQLYDIFDLICYIIHGCIAIGFYKILHMFSPSEITFAALGGLFYLIGGIVYGMEKPNIFPHSFGFHELFHLCTIFANSFFGIIISKKYVMSLVQKVLVAKINKI